MIAAILNLAILNSAILNLAILESAILVFPLKLTHTCQDWFPPFAQKKTFTHSFWLNLTMAAIMNSTMLDSDTAILDSDTFSSSLRFTQKHSPSTLTQTNSIWLTWWWIPSWIMPSSIQPFCTKLWLKLIQSDSNSFILTQIDDGSHLEFCHLEFGHLGFSHLSFSSQTHSYLPGLVPTICTKKTSLTLPSPSFAHKKNFTHSFWLNVMMAAILNSTMLDSDTAIMDSDTFLSSLRFTQKHSPSTLTLTQTNLIWLKLIHSHSTWWWQPSWIWPSWIQPS